MGVEKRRIRQHLRQQRRGLPAADVEAAGVAVCALLRAFAPYRSAASVVAYIPQENEVPTEQVIDDVIRSHRKLYLPRGANGTALVRWRPGEPLVAGAGGVFEPSEGTAEQPDIPAIVLLPVVAWDAEGTRVGRGGGFYDRVLVNLTRGTVRVGLAYEFQEFAELPRDAWDVSMHYVITERRIVRCACKEVVADASFQKGRLQP